MSEYTARITWKRAGAVFSDRRYSRAHRWIFDGGIEVPASSSPHVVPPPMSLPEAIDPEEAFVAALASCHMLFFLGIAAARDFVVDEYRDEAVGEMGKTAEGRMAMTRVVLRPAIRFAGGRLPAAEEFQAMHHLANEECYIANSVRTEVVCEPIIER